jgi:hypothetical protein
VILHYITKRYFLANKSHYFYFLLSIENIVERGVFARSFVFLVDVEDLWQFIGVGNVGKRMFFV